MTTRANLPTAWVPQRLNGKDDLSGLKNLSALSCLSSPAILKKKNQILKLGEI